jgi:hypothetical protein
MRLLIRLTMAATNKCLARNNKSRTGANATKRQEKPYRQRPTLIGAARSPSPMAAEFADRRTKMKRFYMLLLAGAMLLPIGASTTTHAELWCNTVRDIDGLSDCLDDDYLTPAEKELFVHLMDVAHDRYLEHVARETAKSEEARIREEERERVRRSQCKIPALWIGCPPKDAIRSK